MLLLGGGASPHLALAQPSIGYTVVSWGHHPEGNISQLPVMEEKKDEEWQGLRGLDSA